jgi:aldehyde:ferredoxin oxidoreductase
MAGRTGMGAVMGSKNLKAVAVHGTQKIEVTEEYAKLRSEANRTLKQDNEAKVMHELGSAVRRIMPNISARCPPNIITRAVLRKCG